MNRLKPSKYARRGRLLLVGLPDLQRTFDELKGGGGLVLDVSGEPNLGIDQMILVDNDRLQEIAHEVALEGIDPRTLN